MGSEIKGERKDIEEVDKKKKELKSRIEVEKKIRVTGGRSSYHPDF